jgi:hypothetical protein
LSQHGGGINSSNQENFFAMESFGQMDEGALKAILSELDHHQKQLTYLSPFRFYWLPFELAALTKTCLGKEAAESAL